MEQPNSLITEKKGWNIFSWAAGILLIWTVLSTINFFGFNNKIPFFDGRPLLYYLFGIFIFGICALAQKRFQKSGQQSSRENSFILGIIIFAIIALGLVLAMIHV
jgi:hypothetical protein